MSNALLDTLLTRADVDPRLREAVAALRAGNLPMVQALLRSRLKEQPDNVACLCILAEAVRRGGGLVESEQLLRQALNLEPTFGEAREALAEVLDLQQRPAEAQRERNRRAALGRGPAGGDILKAEAASRLGDHDEAIALYSRVLAEHPRDAGGWLSLGHNLRAVGRIDDAVAAYRHAVAIVPHFGEAWWSLANLKTFRFTEADLETMNAAAANTALRPADRVNLNFAIGKALEDREQWRSSFDHYAAANRERRASLRYRAGDYRRLVERSMATFTADFFKERGDWGAPAADPIFVVGLPRSGSTLVEQILASHPLVEGTREHHAIGLLAKRIACPDGVHETHPYPETLAEMDKGRCRALGEEYLELMSAYRVTDKPYFVDKLPGNWLHAGFIRLILPNARIVDARRHPFACGFSNFKQHFARGQAFTYDLADIGDFYVQYVRLMRHMDAVMPRPPVRILNEALVSDPEGEIRQLVAKLGLPWDDHCLRHHENRRAVRTPSAEQVRQPVNDEGVDRWRRYADWLGPLRDALGDTATDWER